MPTLLFSVLPADHSTDKAYLRSANPFLIQTNKLFPATPDEGDFKWNNIVRRWCHCVIVSLWKEYVYFVMNILTLAHKEGECKFRHIVSMNHPFQLELHYLAAIAIIIISWKGLLNIRLRERQWRRVRFITIIAISIIVHPDYQRGLFVRRKSKTNLTTYPFP